ncbi:serine/threonine-protein kinase [Kitasatospora cineracea]|uniref:non-specific serine/threonine protein kinase n=1 Tax=Kitasatospora cineracea TaxID=88074 RepID=A0A3N4R8Z0_9ACTN|nr:serine/threonine-protein kinase [Kitasatospora cineracea]RPE29662.1 serine/threonine protein kinase [Kitasatospora cineracea]
MTAVRMLAARYRLDELIGRGGMGQVWHGWDVALQRRVAVKLLHTELHDPRGTDLFLNEARLAAGLGHPGIVTVHDLGREPDGTVYLVMELLTGTDLAVRLRADGPPPVAEAVDWTLQLCDALAFAHAAQVVHRDLKPANLFLARNGRLKILDFGIAKHHEGRSDTHSRVMGTMAYMPPERFHGRSGDHRGDLYALGCVLFEFLTGRPPFGAGDPVPLMMRHLAEPPRPPGPESLHPVPPALDRLVLDLLAKDPAARPRSAAEVTDRLRGLATGNGIESGDGSRGPRTPWPTTVPADAPRFPTAATVPTPAPATPPTAATFPLPTPAPLPAPAPPADTRPLPPTALTAPLPAPELGSHAGESTYVDWIRTLDAAGQLPLPEQLLARHGRGYQSTAWVDAVARAWPAAGIGALLATYEDARLPRLANEIVRSIPARRTTAELPALLAGLREAGQHLRLTMLTAALEALDPQLPHPAPAPAAAPAPAPPSATPAAPAAPVATERAALLARFAHRTRAVEAERAALLVRLARGMRAVAARPGVPPFAAVVTAVGALTAAGVADEAAFLEWIRSRPSGPERFRAEWLPTLHQVRHPGISPDDLVTTVARAWPAAELGAVVAAFHAAGQFAVAERLVCLAPAVRASAEFPDLVAGFRRAGQHGRLEVLLREAGRLSPLSVAAAAANLTAAGEADAALTVLHPRPMTLSERRNLLLNRGPLR